MDFFHLNINFGVAKVDFGDCSFIEKGNKYMVNTVYYHLHILMHHTYK